MNLNLIKIYRLLGVNSSRSINLTKQIIWSFIYKGGSILISFLLVPLTIKYLNQDNYGVWLTLSSFLGWFTFFDIGMGNGLRNKFTEAKAKGDIKLARGIVSSAYFTIGSVSIGLAILFVIFNPFIDWVKFFNTSVDLKQELSLLMPIIFCMFCLQLTLKLISTIYSADLRHSEQGKISFYTSLISLIVIWILTYFSVRSLLIFGVIFSAIPNFVLLFFTIYGFKNHFVEFRPLFQLWNAKHLKDILGLGSLFFILQVSGLFLYSTDNYIISKMFSPKEVVSFNLAYKYLGIPSMVFTLILAPYWSSITDAYNRSEFGWIDNSIKKFNQVSYFFIVLIWMLALISDFVYELWIGPQIKANWLVTISLALFFSMVIIVTPYTMLLNGIGKIKLQMTQSVIVAIINIPLSIFLCQIKFFGLSGVAIATIVCFFPSLILAPMQSKKILNNSASGFWAH